MNFCSQKFKRRIPATFGFNRTALHVTQIELFEDDVVWPPRSCDLTPYYADKAETIDALKDNIRKAIGVIQLRTIDNVLKNWTDLVGYCRGSHLNEISFHY